MLIILGLASVVAASPYNQMAGQPYSNMWSYFNNWQNYGIPAGNYFSGNGLVNNFNFIPDDLNDLIICLSMASMESLNKMMNRVEPDVMALMKSIETISKLSEPAPVIREVADLMRKFQPLGETDFQDFEKCFTGLNYDNYNGQALSSFFTQQKSIISRLNNFCTEDYKFNTDSIAAIGDMMEQIADLVGSFDSNAAEKFRYWIESGSGGVMATLQNIDLENIDCFNFGDISSLSKLLDDAATAIENGSMDSNYGSSTTSKMNKNKSTTSQASQNSNQGKTLQWRPTGRPFEVCIAPGETLTFVWSSGHNVNEVSETEYADCSGITNTSPTRGPYTFQTETEGVRFFVCGVWTHCSSSNHKAKVTISNNCQS